MLKESKELSRFKTLMTIALSVSLITIMVAWGINAYYVSLYWMDKAIATVEILLTILFIALCIRTFTGKNNRFYYFKVVFFCFLSVFCADTIYGMFILKNSDYNLWYGFWILYIVGFAFVSFVINIAFDLFDYNSKKYIWVFSILLTLFATAIPELEKLKSLGDISISGWNIIIYFLIFNFIWCALQKLINLKKQNVPSE